MSAIANKKQINVVQLPRGTGTKILDTRKTTPGIRALEKMGSENWSEVKNHRFASL